MSVYAPLSDELHLYISSDMNLHQLAHNANVPLTTIHRWLNGHTKRPHTWQPLLRLAAALNLNAESTDKLLAAARHPSLNELSQRVSLDKDLKLLAHWAYSPQQNAPSHNLSLGQLTSCIGREDAIEAILKRLQQVRMLTLTGPGGSGKTRLALEVARNALSHFADGVFFVDLVPLSDPVLLISSIAQTLNVKEQSDEPIDVRLLSYLRDCRMLLILDNFEHLITATPDVVRLLQAAPHVTILATSRILLRVAGEHEWGVKPLQVPPRSFSFEQISESPAVKLFAERAQAARHDFILSPENATVVADLCRRVDGLPLGIELAAARSRMFSPQALLDQMPNSLRLHSRGMETVPERHRSLDALLDWSYTRLAPAEQALLRRLSVFAGDFTIPAAEAVCSGGDVKQQDVVELLMQLVDHSLIVVDQQPQASFEDMRYRMLETIRQYSQAKLLFSAEASAIAARHRDWYLELVQQAEEEVIGPDQQSWLQRLDREYANIRAALEWNATPDGDPVLQIRFLVALWRYWDARGLLSEGNRWHTSAIERRTDSLLVEAGGELWARLLDGAATLAYGLGDAPRAQTYYDQSLAMFRALGNRLRAAGVLTRLGIMKYFQGEYRQASELFDESLGLYQELDDDAGQAWVFTTLGDIAHIQNDYPRASELFEQSRTLWQRIGNRRNVAWLTKNLATMACDQGDYTQASQLLDECMGVFREIGDTVGVCYTMINQGRLARYQGDAPQATHLLEQSLETLREIGDKSTMTIVLNHLGEVARDQQDDLRARALFGEALSLSEQLGNKWTKAWTLNDLGDIARDHGDEVQAITMYQESLALRRAMDDRIGIAYVLESLAELSCLKSDIASVQRAAELWGAADVLRANFHIPLPKVEAERYQHIVAAARERIGGAGWSNAWERGRRLPLDQLIAPWDAYVEQD